MTLTRAVEAGARAAQHRLTEAQIRHLLRAQAGTCDDGTGHRGILAQIEKEVTSDLLRGLVAAKATGGRNKAAAALSTCNRVSGAVGRAIRDMAR